MAILVQFRNDMTSLYAWFNRRCSGYRLTDSLLGVVSLSSRASTCGKSRVSHTECTCEARSPSVGPNRAAMPRSSWLHAERRPGKIDENSWITIASVCGFLRCPPGERGTGGRAYLFWSPGNCCRAARNGCRRTRACAARDWHRGWFDRRRT